MKRNYLFFAILCIILFLNIVFTQYVVHQYYFENYLNVLIFCALNIALFPIALFIYKKDVKTHE
ncbi:hypothetical protein [Lederbergia citrea]|uniref:Uncharacterized protein n=1 Tax=Lederbergia citrea TaxID=2833581 RepID=A0A942UR53_9BACI|nr:hypothetical protein [Lederbergia citrea]MBS4179255.1 hypothetical protein [Lederbergia citrea]MBS4205919.1 hypothetical protein [Lederbergia citrea]MBS4224632.1 hypothetical protein [Lederbergia citrea]